MAEHGLNVVVMESPQPFGPFDARTVEEYAEMFHQHTEPRIVDSSAFGKAFGVAPTPLPRALDETIAWYRDILAVADP